MVYLGADHAGYKLKEVVKKYLEDKKIPYEDLGAHESNPDDDYPDYGKAVAQKVVENQENFGILFCGSGQGICIAANKFPGIRAVQAWNSELAHVGRNDDNINILCLAGRYTDERNAIAIVETFLNTPFERVDRRERRIKKISQLEIKN